MHAELLARRVAGRRAGVRRRRRRGDGARGRRRSSGVPAVGGRGGARAGDADAVAICTSTDTHADLIAAAARAGKAIFCEKPVSLDLAEVDRALREVEAAGVPFQIGFNRRFDPAHQAVHDAVAGGDGRRRRSSCASPAATPRRRRSPTSRCPAGSSST